MSRVALAKAWLAALGLTTGIVGMALQARWLIWAGVSLLAIAFGLRLVERKSAIEP